MLYINFILNEKQQVECIGYSEKPTTEFGFEISQYDNDSASLNLIISDQCSDEEINIIQHSLDKMKEKCEEILAMIDKSQCIQQINRGR